MKSKEKLLLKLSEKREILSAKGSLHHSVTRILITHYKLSSEGELLHLYLFGTMELHKFKILYDISHPLVKKRAFIEKRIETRYLEITATFADAALSEIEMSTALLISFLDELSLYPELIGRFNLLKMVPQRVFFKYYDKFDSNELQFEMGFYLRKIRGYLSSRYMELCVLYPWLNEEVLFYERKQEEINKAVVAKMNREELLFYERVTMNRGRNE